MRYLLLVAGAEEAWAAVGAAEADRGARAVARWEAGHRAAGRIVDGGPLAPVRSATTVRGGGGRVVVCDGPSGRPGEVIGGYYVLDVPDLDEALAVAAGAPLLDHAAIEIRPLIDPAPGEGAAG